MKIPDIIVQIGKVMNDNGNQAYLVGGCVRDLLLGVEPKDWDLASAALPQEITALFPHSHYDNDFGTVRIVNDEVSDERLKVVEITTFRQDLGYSDNRRPDQVTFSKNLDDDLERRDFTINALAYPLSDSSTFSKTDIIDRHSGLVDLESGVIRTVNDPDERFGEDGLRLIRAVRFAAQLSFMIESDTMTSITSNASLLEKIAIERITDEFNKLVLTNNPAMGLELLHRTNLLSKFIPELEEGIGVEQNQAHSYTVWEHLLRTLQAAADKEHGLDMRLAALFHDIAKPATKEVSSETKQPTFYNHEMVGSKMTKSIMKRLKYPRELVSRVTMMVRWHMFFSDPDEVTLSAVRRLIANVGSENIWDLVNLRICDRIGTGRPKEQPYRLRKFKAMIEEAQRSPTSVKMLAISGNDLMTELDIEPGRIIGDILNILLNEVLDDPAKNEREVQLQRAKQIQQMDSVTRETLVKHSKAAINDFETAQVRAIRDKHHVK